MCCALNAISFPCRSSSMLIAVGTVMYDTILQFVLLGTLMLLNRLKNLALKGARLDTSNTMCNRMVNW